VITVEQYFITREHSPEQGYNAIDLLIRVNALMEEYTLSTGRSVPINKSTGSQISGTTEGGFRLPNCSQGATLSSHKEAKAVDVYDPDESLDSWITRSILIKYDLYREHPDKTMFWCHLTTRPPKSGTRTFLP
jgi:hypothetical protein